MSSRQSRAAVVRDQRAQRRRRPGGHAAKPGRSECATTASITAVRGGPSASGAQRRGVGLDDAAGALAVDDLHRDRARVGAAERGVHRHAEALADGERHLDEKAVLGRRAVDGGAESTLQRGERVRVQPGAVPRVEPVGDRRPPARSGRSRWRRRRARPAGGRGPEHRGVGDGLVRPSVVEAHPGEHAVVVARAACASPAGRRARGPCRASGRPGRRRARARRTARRPGAGRRRARRRARRRRSRQATSSRPATVRPNARPGRTSRLAGHHEPAPRTAAPAPGCSAARISPGLASAQVGCCSAHAGRRRRRSGLNWRSFTRPG